MTCHDLAARIEQLQPGALPREVARLCLLLTNYVEDLEELAQGERLSQAWQEMGIRLQAATDQHAAMTADLERLARTDPANSRSIKFGCSSGRSACRARPFSFTLHSRPSLVPRLRLATNRRGQGVISLGTRENEPVPGGLYRRNRGMEVCLASSSS